MNCPICNAKIIKNPSQTYVIYCSDECKKKGKSIKNKLWYENNRSRYKEYSKKNAEQKKVYLKEKYKSDPVFRELKKQKASQRYHLNKESIKSKVNEYRLKNKEVINNKKKIWGETTGYHKLYYKKNSEKKKAYKLAYIKTEEGKFKTNFWNANRRAMLKNVIHEFTKKEWSIKLKKGKCAICDKFIGINKLTLDHIYPLSKANEDYKLTGVKRIYYINDIQPVCKSCNSSKKDKLEPKETLKKNSDAHKISFEENFISNINLIKYMKATEQQKALQQRPTDVNPSYSYNKGDESKNDRVNFKHWNDLLYAKEKGEKDTTYSSLWLFRKAKMIPPFTDSIGSSSPAEAKRKGVEYFSEFNPLVSQNITNYWADKNDVILDPFGGRTRGIVSGLTHRKYFGFEISPIVYKSVMEVIESGKDKFDEGFKPIIYNDDSFNVDKYNNISEVDCIFSCPPYWNLEQYESVPGQLSDIKDYNLFLERLKQIMEKCITKLKENGFICLVVGDFRKDEKLISFETDTIKMMESIPEIVLWDKIVLQNIDLGWASRKFGSIKHKRIVSKVTEYLLIFKKPNTKIIS